MSPTLRKSENLHVFLNFKAVYGHCEMLVAEFKSVFILYIFFLEMFRG